MKWFKHYSDAYINLKHRAILREFGVAGYGFYWLILELVAQQGGVNFQISKEKEWSTLLLSHLMEGNFLQNSENFSKISEKSSEKITQDFDGLVNRQKKYLEILLSRFAKIGLIDEKALKKGILWVPKMKEYQDEYREKIQRRRDVVTTQSRQNRDFVRLEEDKIRRRLEERGERGEKDINLPSPKPGRGKGRNTSSSPKGTFLGSQKNNPKANLDLAVSEILNQEKLPREFLDEQVEKFTEYYPGWVEMSQEVFARNLRNWIKNCFDREWYVRCKKGGVHRHTVDLNNCGCQTDAEVRREKDIAEAIAKCPRKCGQGENPGKQLKIDSNGYRNLVPCECVEKFFPQKSTMAEKAEIKNNG